MNHEQLGEWLSAYLDGELTEGETVIIERALEEDAGARALLEELRRSASVVSSLPRHRAPASILEDVRFQVERAELLDDARESIPQPISRSPRPAMRWAMAATVGFAAVGAMWMMVDQHQRPGVDSSMAESQGVRAVLPMEEAAPATHVATAERSSRAAGGKAKGVPDERIVGRGSVTSDALSIEKVTALPSRRDAVGPSDAEPVEAILNMKQKLARGVPADKLRDHRFGNESVRLEVRVKDIASRDRLEKALLAQLTAGDMANLKSAPAAGKPERFFIPGTTGVNFSSHDRRQVLVRAPADEIERLVQVVGDPSASASRMALVLDDLRISGKHRVTDTFRQLGGGGDSLEEAEGPVLADASSTRDGTAAGRAKIPWALEEIVEVLTKEPQHMTDASSDKRGPQPTDDAGAGEQREGQSYAARRRGGRSTAPGLEGKKAKAAKSETPRPRPGAKRAETPEADAEQSTDDAPPPPAERPSLVKRRIREAKDAARAKQKTEADSAPSPTFANRGGATTPSARPVMKDQPLITLVVDLIPPAPAKARKTTPAKAKPAPPTKPKPASKAKQSDPDKKKQ